jgi:hypothetical protein
MTIDTEKLVNELKRTSVVVGSFTLQYRDTPTAPPLGISGDGFVAELKKRNIGIGDAVELKSSQIDDLKSCLQAARNDSEKCKAELLKEFLGTLQDIATPVKSVLNNAAGGSAIAISPQVGMRTAADELQALLQLIQLDPKSGQQIFGPEALEKMQFDQLNEAVSFLRKGSQSDGGAYRRAVLPLFLNQLSLYEQLVKVNIRREWIFDALVEKTESEAASFLAEGSERLAGLKTKQSERLASLRSDMFQCAMLSGVAVLGTAIVALMLLILRDFLSALVDTAVNTGATATTLDKMRQGDTGSTATPEENP